MPADYPPGRKFNLPLETTQQGGGANYPPEFKESVPIIATSKTGKDLRADFVTPDPSAAGKVLESIDEQKTTQERVQHITTADFSNILLTSATADPLFGIIEQIDRSIITTPSSTSVQDAFGRYIKNTPLNKWQDLQEATSWSDPSAIQDTFNFEINYDEAHASYPEFARRYLYARDNYTRLANGTAFTGVYGVQVTNGGTGYTNGASVTFTGDGTGATGNVIVVGGIIKHILMLTEGTGYTTCTASVAGGSGATFTVLLQPATCLLVKENTHEGIDTWSSRAPWRAKFMIVIRFYKTLPGPARVSIVRDVDGGDITETKTAKIAGSITTGESYDGGTKVWTVLDKEFVSGYTYFADEIKKEKVLPGPTVTAVKTHVPTGAPVIIARTIVSGTIAQTTGEFTPPALTISGIGLGATSTITFTTAHNLPPLAWVTFSSTNSTPVIDGVLQILTTPSSTTVTVTPASAVTLVGTSGSAQPTILTRDLDPISHTSIAKMRVDSLINLPAISSLNENVATWKDFPFPDFADTFNFYLDQAATRSVATSGSFALSANFSGVVGIPRQAGYKGPSRARRLRYFFLGPPPDDFAGGKTVTITSANPGVVTWAAHGFAAGDSVSFSTTGTLPNNLATVTTYYVSNSSLTSGTFRVSATHANALSGTNIDTSGGSPSGTHTGYRFSPTFIMLAAGTIAIEGGSMGLSASPASGTVGRSFSNNWKLQTIPPMLNGGSVELTPINPNGSVAVPIAISSISITSPYSGTIIGITTATPHGFTSNFDRVVIKDSGTTPSLDGIWTVGALPSTTVFEIFPDVTVTAGSSGVGHIVPGNQAQGFIDMPDSIPLKFTQGDVITIVEQAQRLGFAGVWDCYVWLITVPYTSGLAPV